MRRNQRSPQAKQYRASLKGPRWEAMRLAQLSRQPLCEHCLKLGLTRAARVVDHITPHRGDPKLFWAADNLQSLCFHHHNSHKQSLEREDAKLSAMGMRRDADGWLVRR